MILDIDSRTGGLALVLGYALLLGILFRNPSSGLSAATATLGGTVFFHVLPVAGVASGVYSYLDGPLSGVAVVVTATYLGAVGVALALPFTDVSAAVHVLGLVEFALAAVALVGTLRSAVAVLGLGELP